MLGKLFKHEFKATARIFLPLFAMLAVISVVNKLLPANRAMDSVFSGFLVIVPILLYACIVVALSAMPLVVLIQRFSKNLLGDEGYLSNTLPVPSWQHVLCKLTTSTFWSLLSTLVITLSVMFTVSDVRDWANIWTDFQELLQIGGKQIGVSGVYAFWGFLLVTILFTMEKTLMIYAGMAIGNCAAKHKGALSVGAVIALNIAEQIIAYLVMALLARVSRSLNFLTLEDNAQALRLMFYWVIGNAVVFGGIYACITNWMLKHRLNLA